VEDIYVILQVFTQEAIYQISSQS